jgi:V/A-type H+-transporting ATPase subunit I
MITPMSRIEIVCMRGTTRDVVAFVQDQGMVHLEDVPLVVLEDPGFLNPLQATQEEQRDQTQLERLNQDLLELAPLLSVKPPRQDIDKAAAGLAAQERELWERQVRDWNRLLRPLARGRVNHADNVAVINQYVDMLSALAPQLDKRDFRLGVGARFVVIPSADKNDAAALAELLKERLGPEVQFLHQRVQRKVTAGLVLYPEAMDAAVETVLRESGVTPVDAPEAPVKGMPFDAALAKLGDMRIAQQKQLVAAQEKLTEASCSEGARLLALKAIVGDMLQRHLVSERMAGSELVTVIHGWVPSESLEDFRVILEKRFGEGAMLAELPMENVSGESVPTRLENPKFFKPFELLLQLYQPPTYGGIDPSIWVGVSFILFYGFIIGDVFYGALFLGLALYLRRRFRDLEVVQSLGMILAYMGVSAMVFGVVFGEYMGNLLEHYIPPLWDHRMGSVANIMVLMKVSLVVGIVHVSGSLVLGIREAARHGHRGHAMEKIGMLTVLWGLIIAVLGQMTYLPATGSMMAGIGLIVTGVATMFAGLGLGALVPAIELTSLATNVLSYTRLMALGLASAALADIGNQFMTDNYKLGGIYIVVGILINFCFQALNIALGLFSPTLHSLRLNYVESLPKFYDPKGFSYKPFRKELPW